MTIEEGQDPVSNEALGDIQQQAQAILEEGGQDIVATAQSMAPVVTGRLQASIFYAVVPVRGLILGATAPYAAAVEDHSPFLQPAIDIHEPMIQEDLDQMIADRLGQDSGEDDPEYEFYRVMEEAE